MAENAANLMFTFQTQPSIFEVIAQKSFNDTLHPAFEKIALVLATKFPKKFSWLNYYYEEAFLTLNGLLQYHYLKYYDASFSECYYGLKRVLVDNSQITKHHKELSLLFLVLLPYFNRKVEEKVSIIKIEQAEGGLQKDSEGIFKKLILFSYSTFELIWGLITVYNYLKYISNEIGFQTPLYKLIGLKLTHAVEPHDSDQFWSAVFKRNFSITNAGFELVKKSIRTSLELGAFFLQFLRTWDQQKCNYHMTDLPIITAPSQDDKARTVRGKCPICLKTWTLPTVLQVSGYIFCFRCILKYLNEYQQCPVTKLPAKPLDVIRLYVS